MPPDAVVFWNTMGKPVVALGEMKYFRTAVFVPVIDGLVPVTATLSVKGRATSIHVQADENEITSQVVK